MAGYIRQSVADIINGAEITAPPLNAEFNQLVAAFSASSGHTHTGATGDAPKINLTTSVSGVLPAANGGTGGANKMDATTAPVTANDNTQGYAPGSLWENVSNGRVYICVGNATGAAVWRELVTVFTNNKIEPVAHNTIDLGTPTIRFQDLYLQGGIAAAGNTALGGTFNVTGATTLATANITGAATMASTLGVSGNVVLSTNLNVSGTSTLSAVDINSGSIDNAAIGVTTASTGAFTTLTTSGQATLASADINGGSVDGAVIGSGTPADITGTLVTATTGFVGGLTGNVTGNLTGNSAGTHTGAVVGNVTGNVTASSGLSTFNNVTVNGTLDVTGTTIANVTDPSNAQDAATKNYVDTADALKLNLSGGTMSGNVAMGGNTVTGLAAPSATTDATTKTYVDTADALKLNLAGGTMSGPIAMGSNKVTGVGTPTAATDAANKAYVDAEVSAVIDAAPGALDTLNELAAAINDDANFSTTITNSIATKLPLSGGTMSGDISLGANKATSTATPATDDTLTRKGYVDTQDALKLNLAGGTMSGDITLGSNKATSSVDPATADTLARKAYIDNADALKLNLSGGTMSGSIAMGTSKITGVGDPTSNQDVATKVYTDTQRDTRVAKSGDTMSGNLAMGSNKVTGLATPTATGDATNKSYVDGILGSATAAASSASAASTSATNAATSATNAASSAASAAASYDDFDDRYLGAKSSAPSTDNDGNSLLTGALYWNTSSNALFVWSGSAWNAGAFDTSNALVSTNNLSDLNNAATARTNLGFNAGVDAHLNTSTASNGEYLSWNGSDYDWASVPAGYADSDVDTHLNTGSASSGQYLGWNGSDYAWATVDTSTLMPKAGGTFTGDVTFDGASYNAVWDKSDNALEFADNAKAIFGAGSDLQIYHDGSNSYIKETNTGDLYIDANFLHLQYGSNTKLSTYSGGISVTGNIGVSGTVDGRDVAADGTKLDGIETNATADQTKADIDALNINADLLDGQHGSYYTGYTDTAISNLVDSSPSTLNTLNELAAALGDDANFSTTVTNSIATKMPLAGGTFTGDVTFTGANYNILFDKSQNSLEFADNAKATFGDSRDLQIYHDGNSVIRDDGSGDLELRGSNAISLMNAAGTEYKLRAYTDGAVNLYYDNAVKVATTSGGASVTGTLEATYFSGDGSQLTNLPSQSDSTKMPLSGGTFTGDVKFNDNVELQIGSSADWKMYHAPTVNYMDISNGSLEIRNFSDDSDVSIKTDNGSGSITEYFRADGSDGSAKLFHYGSEKITTNNTGVQVTGTIMGDRLDIDNVEINGGTITGQTGALSLSGNVTIENGTLTAQDDVTFTGASYNAVWDKSANSLRFADNAKAVFGDGSDASIHWNGSALEFSSELGDVLIRGNNEIKLQAHTGENFFVGLSNGASTLYYDNSAKLATSSSGVSVTGNIGVSGTVDGRDIATDGTKLDGIAAGANVGIPTTGGTFTGDVTFNEDLLVGQNDKLWLGYSSGNSNMGLQLFHGGTSATIENHNFVTTYKSDGHTFKRHSTDREYMTLNEDTNHTVSLKAAGSTRLQTSGTGVTVTGTLAATAVTGDGSGLTNLPAGASNVNTNFIGGTNAGTNLAAGAQYNTLLGQEAGNDLTTGDYNVHVGYDAGSRNTIGEKNVAIGYQSLYGSYTSYTSANVAIGHQAMKSSAGASSAVAIGTYAGMNNTTADEFIYIGYQAGKDYTTVSGGVHIGNLSGSGATGGVQKVAIGHQSAQYNNGDYTVAIGYEAGRSVTGSGSTGDHNIALGYYSGREMTTGFHNITIGANAGTSLTTGTNNVLIGRDTAQHAAENHSGVAVGAYAGGALNSSGGVSNSVAVGYESGGWSQGGRNTYLGYESGKFRTTGNDNTAIGNDSQRGQSGSTTMTSALPNTSVGSESLFNITTALGNVAMGYRAGRTLTSGGSNTIIGNDAGYALTTSSTNILIGNNAGKYGQATESVGIGYASNGGGQSSATNNNRNVMVGHEAGSYGSNSHWNTGVGYRALKGITTGQNNVTLGREAGDNVTTGSNNIVIGANVEASSATVSNEITIGDGNITRFRVPGAGIDNTSAALSGTTPSIDVSARDTYTLTTSGNTTFSFTNPPSSPQVGKFTLILTAGGTHTLTWPSSVDWAGGSAPDAPASGEKNIYTFITIDGGSTYYGFLAGAAFA